MKRLDNSLADVCTPAFVSAVSVGRERVLARQKLMDIYCL